MTLVTLPKSGHKGASVKLIMRFDGPHFFLSNMYPCAIILPAEGDCPELEFEHLEGAYQASKTLKPKIRKHIQSLSGKKAKEYAQSQTFYDKHRRHGYCDALRLRNMKFLIDQKFSDATAETQELSERLMATAPTTLVEGNYWGDTFFGFCFDQGKGENHLGRMLMARRDILLAE